MTSFNFPPFRSIFTESRATALERLGSVGTGLVFLLLLLPACSESPQRLRDDRGKLIIPSWYKLHFVLHYPDGRRYEGSCRLPPGYDKLVEFDIRQARAYVKPGKIVRSVREIHGPRAYQFVPEGHGTMIYPDGTRRTGFWRAGAFVGPVRKGESKPAPAAYSAPKPEKGTQKRSP